MSIHILLFGLIFGFAAVAALSARGIIRQSAHSSNGLKSHIVNMWVFGGCATFVASVIVFFVADQGEHPHITPVMLYPLFALLMIAGGYTVTWYQLNNRSYRLRVRAELRNKEQARRRRRRSSARTSRPRARARR